METRFKIKNKDIAILFESFRNDIANTYGVTDSRLTDVTARLKNSGISLKEITDITIPSSSGALYLGGSNIENTIKIAGQPVDVALKGCRPIGIPIARLTTGIHYINRLNGKTWLSSLPNSETGIILEYNPKYIHVELIGGGGGGGGTGYACCSAGGGGGGYSYKSLAIPENSHLQFVVGAKGNGGNGREGGAAGGKSSVLNANGVQICSAYGGGGGGYNSDNGGSPGEAVGGKTNISGGEGGRKENNGTSVGKSLVILDKPEQSVWTRGGTNGGISNGNNYGGGGGASAFSNGADGNSLSTPAPPSGYGGGGAGGGYSAKMVNGGNGGEGLINIYY